MLPVRCLVLMTRSPLERKMLKLVFEFCRSRFGGCMNCYCFFPVFLEQNNKRSVVFLKKKGDKLILFSNQPVSFYNQPVCNHQKVRSTTLSRYVIRTSSKGDLYILCFCSLPGAGLCTTTYRPDHPSELAKPCKLCE